MIHAKIVIPITPIRISTSIGPMICRSMSGVQSFKPSKTYIISANIMMLKEFAFTQELTSRNPKRQKTTPKTKAQMAPEIPVSGPN